MRLLWLCDLPPRSLLTRADPLEEGQGEQGDLTLPEGQRRVPSNACGHLTLRPGRSSPTSIRKERANQPVIVPHHA